MSRNGINHQLIRAFSLIMARVLFLILFLMESLIILGQNHQSDSMLRALQNGSDTSRVKAHIRLAKSLHQSGEVDSGQKISTQGISLLRQVRKEKRDMAASMSTLFRIKAVGFYRKGNMPQTQVCLDSSWHYAKIASDSALMVAVIGVRGAVAEFQGDHDSAVAAYQKAYEFMLLTGDTPNQILYLNNMAGVYKRLQQYEKAADIYKKSLAVSSNAGLLESEARSYKGLGDIAYYQGLFNLALENYSKSVPLYEKAGAFNGLNNVIANRALVYKAQGEYDAALKTYRQTLMGSIKMGKEKGMAEDYQLIGEIHELKGNLDSAEWYFNKSLEISERIGYPRGIGNSRGVLARIYREQAKLDEAEGYALSAIKLFEEQENEYRVWLAKTILADILLRQGRISEAHTLAAQCFVKGKELEILSLQKSAAVLEYQALKEKGRYREALEKFEVADQLKDSLQNKELRESAIRADLEYTYQKASLADSLKAAQDRFDLTLAYRQEIEAQKVRESRIIAAVLLFLIIAIGLFTRVRFIQRTKQRLQKEKDRSDELLLNILPSEVAEELKMHGQSEARDFEQVTVLFTDFKEFTQASENLSAKELVGEINTCFRAFDGIIEKHGIEKIKTIGDSYMAAGGLHEPRRTEVKDVILAGLEMQQFLVERKKVRMNKNLPAFEMRVGINTGPVVAGIVGVKKFQYDIWGDTVNTASRMESHGMVGEVNISEYTYLMVKDLVHEQTGKAYFNFKRRGKIEVKGKGELEMLFVTLNNEDTNQ